MVVSMGEEKGLQVNQPTSVHFVHDLEEIHGFVHSGVK